jgi:hypothetical protein
VPATIESVGHTIRSSLLIDIPLRCEPGYSDSCIQDTMSFSQCAEFLSLDFSIRQAIRSPPTGFAEFHDELVQYFFKHMNFYMAKLQWLHSKRESIVLSNEYEDGVTLSYAAAKRSLLDLYKSLNGKRWANGGKGGFNPKERIWYPECDQDVLERREERGDRPESDSNE